MRPALAVLLALCACRGGDATQTDAATGLADGRHFGFVTALDPSRFRLTFDDAQLLSGRAAADAAEGDGTVVTQGGSYVRNHEPRARPVTLDDDIVVRLLRPCCELRTVPFEEWLAGFTPGDRAFYGTAASHYWITVADGRVVAVAEHQVT